MRSQRSGAFLSIFLASFLFGFMAFLVKILTSSLPAAEILFIRAVLGMVFIMSMVIFGFTAFRVNNRNMLFVRGLFGGTAIFLYFTAIGRLPLSTVALIANSYPLFAIMFSMILIKEKPSYDSMFALMVAFSGLFLVLNPQFGTLDIGYLFALAAAIFGGVAITAVRELRKTDSSFVIIFAQMVGASAICFIPMANSFRVPVLSEWGLLLLITAVGIAGQLYLTRPFKYIKASEGSIIALATAVFAIAFSVMFLGEVLTYQFIAGALLVFGSSFYLIAREEGWVKI
jgi:drug/metabolite transporter (DMT)-like permease